MDKNRGELEGKSGILIRKFWNSKLGIRMLDFSALKSDEFGHKEGQIQSEFLNFFLGKTQFSQGPITFA